MNTSETVQAAQRLLAEREAVGLKKYGTTVDRTDLQAGDWLQHAIEEASDLLLYLIRLQKTMRQGEEFRLHRRAVASGLVSESQPTPATAPEDAERAAYLERWKDAPDSANWLAQDPDGWCTWFSNRPKQVGNTGNWWATGNASRAVDNLLGSVRCEPRPTPAGGQGVQP